MHLLLLFLFDSFCFLGRCLLGMQHPARRPNHRRLPPLVNRVSRACLMIPTNMPAHPRPPRIATHRWLHLEHPCLPRQRLLAVSVSSLARAPKKALASSGISWWIRALSHWFNNVHRRRSPSRIRRTGSARRHKPQQRLPAPHLTAHLSTQLPVPGPSPSGGALAVRVRAIYWTPRSSWSPPTRARIPGRGHLPIARPPTWQRRPPRRRIVRLAVSVLVGRPRMPANLPFPAIRFRGLSLAPSRPVMAFPSPRDTSKVSRSLRHQAEVSTSWIYQLAHIPVILFLVTPQQVRHTTHKHHPCLGSQSLEHFTRLLQRNLLPACNTLQPIPACMEVAVLCRVWVAWPVDSAFQHCHRCRLGLRQAVPDSTYLELTPGGDDWNKWRPNKHKSLLFSDSRSTPEEGFLKSRKFDHRNGLKGHFVL